MDARLLEIRNLTYRMFVELGRAPSIEEVAGATELSGGDVEAAWRALHREHALVLNSTGNEIRMANPFSAVPTAHRVQAAGRWWYGELRVGCVRGLCGIAHGWPHRDVLPGLW